MLRTVVVAACFLFYAAASAQAEIVIQGRGIPPQIPVRVIVNPPDGPRSAIYTLENTGTSAVMVLPSVECPEGTVQATVIELAIEIPAGEARQVEVRFADLEGGAGVGELVECTFSANTTEATVFVRIVAPRVPPSIGSLALEATLLPLNNLEELTPFLIDLQANLRLALTWSGLTLHSDLGLGTTGFEFALFTFETALGTFDLESQFAFAAPFDAEGHALAGGALSFVKKRLSLRFNLFGLEVDNLAILENVKFKHPFADEAEALDAVQTPAYRFGDILQLSGRTATGLPLRLLLGLCADPSRFNAIKKRFFRGAVVCDGGQLGFTVEQLRLGWIRFGGLELSARVEARPDAPVRGRVSLRTSLLDLALFSARISFNNVEGFAFDSARLTAYTPAWTFSVAFSKDFEVSSVYARLRFTIDSKRLTLSLAGSPRTGMLSTSVRFTAPLDRGHFSAQARHSGVGTLDFSRIIVSWNYEAAPWEMDLSVSFTDEGFDEAQISAAVYF